MSTQKSVVKLLDDILRIEAEIAKHNEIFRSFNCLSTLKRISKIEEQLNQPKELTYYEKEMDKKLSLTISRIEGT